MSEGNTWPSHLCSSQCSYAEHLIPATETNRARWTAALAPTQTSATAVVGSSMCAQAQLMLTTSYLSWGPLSVLASCVLGISSPTIPILLKSIGELIPPTDNIPRDWGRSQYTDILPPVLHMDNSGRNAHYALELSPGCQQQSPRWHHLSFSLPLPSVSHCPCSLLLPGIVPTKTICSQIVVSGSTSGAVQMANSHFHVRVTSNL